MTFAVASTANTDYYQVTVTCGTSSQTANVLAVQLVTQTVVQAPDGTPNTRRVIGVAEIVRLGLVPPGAPMVTWNVVGDGTLSQTQGSTNTFTAPPQHATPTVTATFNEFPPLSAQFTVIEPTTETGTRMGVYHYPKGTQGAGMRVRMTFGPANVCFSKVQVQEEVGTGTVTGYFTLPLPGHTPDPHTPFPPVTLTVRNTVPRDDAAAFSGYPSPWDFGRITWTIPVDWNVFGNPNLHRFGTDEVQIMTILNVSGTSRVDKLGCWVVRTVTGKMTVSPAP